MLTHVARTAAETDHSGLLCTILLIATIIAVLIGLAEALGLTTFAGARTGAGRFGGLVLAAVLLVVYAVLC